ncbi:hypothetical protein [Halobacterium hubeiense]|uniref:hypothetical protein n=1 Tax=Halobacterium hubeiense TaxID=1407499 RepID=UPI003C721DE6
MTDADGVLSRVRRSKGDDAPRSVTGTKLLLFGVQLTLLGGLFDGLAALAYVGVGLGLVGLLVAG